MTRVIHVETDRSFGPAEYAELMAAVHWGEPEDYSAANITAALQAYHFIGHVRDEAGLLVGYLCAFSDGVFATFVGELVVHPSARGSGVGAALLEAVESAWPGVPVFAIGFRDARGFFYRQGYTHPPRPIEVLTKLDTWPVGDAITLEASEG
ncbi:MAG: GNAT family N-acetyltransferase [Halofilum sp. (in: g-proteobacteria)]|nr:GNAT family N-acetyltransferase [Halofilum sp. (in: g-proteobacteria)]